MAVRRFIFYELMSHESGYELVSEVRFRARIGVGDRDGVWAGNIF